MAKSGSTICSCVGNALVLQNGCVCCTLRTDLQRALRDLIDGRDNGCLPNFDRIVIETTGLADPAPIAEKLQIDPMLRRQARLANIVTTVDGVHGPKQLRTHVEALRQAASADRIVVTKTDLISGEQLVAVKSALSLLNPTARIFDGLSDRLDATALLTAGITNPATKLNEVQHWLTSFQASDYDRLHEQGSHQIHGAIHSEGIASLSLLHEEPVDWTAFGVWLTALLHWHGDRVLRMKAF